MRISLACLLLATLLAPLAGAQEDIDWYLVWTFYPEEAVGARLLVVPDASGLPFTDARAPGGYPVDATIHLVLTDYQHDPVVNYPAEDLWLASSGQDLAACAGGLCADGPTDEEGAAYWILPRRAGGHNVGETLHGVVSGWELSTEIPLTMVSPDITGDLAVNLADIVLFTDALGGGAGWSRADYNNDQQVNLVDIVLFTSALGADCP